MNSSAEHDQDFPEDHSSLSKARSFPGTAPQLHQLYQPPDTKICYFYKDNDVTFRRLKLTVNKKYYNNVEILKGDLTKKVPGLPFGVRSIFTSRGRHSVGSVDDLEHDSHYVCSTYNKRAKGVDILKVQQTKPSWHGGRIPSGRRKYSESLRDPANIQSLESPRHRKHAWVPPRDSDSGPFPMRPKKITVIDMERPTQRHIILLNRRTAQTFEQVLEDMSQMFQMPCRRLFTLDGKPIRSLSSVFNGPDCYFVTEAEHFKPNTSMSDPPARRRQFGGRHGAVSNRLKDKRDRLSNTRGKWSVWVTSNELPSAGTQAEVTITVYGHKGNSGPIPLGYTDGQTFQSGQVDEFEVKESDDENVPRPTKNKKVTKQYEISVGNIGEIYKIRVAHDNSGEFPGWFLDQVRMRDIHASEELTFDCQRWLSRDEEDCEICRELPSVREGEPILPIIIYEITTVTGDLWNAATSANVYITLYGERGDTGVRQLYKSTRDKFKKGQTDLFTLEAVSLGQLKRAIIGHDGSNAGEGWFLEKLVVRALEPGQTKQPLVWNFPCGKWLDVAEEDAKIVRELKPHNSYNQDLVEKKLFELEKWKYAPECVVMLFSKATQKPVRIKPDSSVDGLGEHNDILGQFHVLPGKGPGPIRIFQSVSNRKFHLAIDNGRIMGKGKGGTYCEFRVRTQEDRSSIFESVKYINQQITVQQNGHIGDPRAQSGDPTKEFVVYCKGMLRDKGIIIMCTSISQTMRINNDSSLYAMGRRDKLAHFKVHKIKEGGIRMFESTVFQGQYVRLKDGQVDCKGNGDQYCEFKVDKIREQGYVILESCANRGLFLGMTPDGRIRPVVNTGDKNIRFYPEVVKFGIQKRRVLSPIPTPIPLPSKPAKVQRQRKQQTPKPPPPREQTPSPEPVRSPTPAFVTDDVEEEEKPSFVDGDWKVFITTEESNDGGDITMVVYGDKGNSSPILLAKSTDSGLFAAGNLDEFKVNLAKVGKIYKIRMELHAPNMRKDPSWKVKEIKMKDMMTNETLKYKYNRWLSKNHDDGDTMRELGAVRPKQKVPKLYTYQVHVYTGTEEGSDTDANVYINLFGEFGDTGKRLLLRSDQKTKFQESQVDRFELEAVDLGKLKRCVISHDGEGPGEGWFCEQVIVRESEESDKEYVFPCNRWLDTSIEDNKIERVLKLKGKAEQNNVASDSDSDTKTRIIPIIAHGLTRRASQVTISSGPEVLDLNNVPDEMNNSGALNDPHPLSVLEDGDNQLEGGEGDGGREDMGGQVVVEGKQEEGGDEGKEEVSGYGAESMEGELGKEVKRLGEEEERLGEEEGEQGEEEECLGEEKERMDEEEERLGEEEERLGEVVDKKEYGVNWDTPDHEKLVVEEHREDMVDAVVGEMNVENEDEARKMTDLAQDIIDSPVNELEGDGNHDSELVNKSETVVDQVGNAMQGIGSEQNMLQDNDNDRPESNQKIPVTTSSDDLPEKTPERPEGKSAEKVGEDIPANVEDSPESDNERTNSVVDRPLNGEVKTDSSAEIPESAKENLESVADEQESAKEKLADKPESAKENSDNGRSESNKSQSDNVGVKAESAQEKLDIKPGDADPIDESEEPTSPHKEQKD